MYIKPASIVAPLCRGRLLFNALHNAMTAKKPMASSVDIFRFQKHFFSHMQKNTNRYLAAIIWTSLFLGSAAWAKGSEKLAVQLLEASDIPRMYAEGIVSSYKKDGAKKKEPETEIKCFCDKVTSKLVLMPLAAGYSKEFSDEELKQATSFFQSESGKKFVRYQRIKVREYLGEISQEKTPEFLDGDLKLVDAFSDTRVGKLMLAPGSPMSATAREILMPELKALRTRCISR